MYVGQAASTYVCRYTRCQCLTFSRAVFMHTVTEVFMHTVICTSNAYARLSYARMHCSSIRSYALAMHSLLIAKRLTCSRAMLMHTVTQVCLHTVTQVCLHTVTQAFMHTVTQVFMHTVTQVFMHTVTDNVQTHTCGQPRVQPTVCMAGVCRTYRASHA